MTQAVEIYEHDDDRLLPAARLAVAPLVKAEELVERLDVIKTAMKTAMEPDVDYGVIPGTGSKPTLLKPGAEKLGALFQLDVQIDNEKIWHDDGHLTVICRATVFHQPTGTRLGSGEGICTTREAKYAFRKGERVCPQCGKTAIIKGKAEFGGGWLCWQRKDGCGAKFSDGDPTIEGQTVGKIANENIADTWNTVDKIASKRARVDAVLAVTGASAIFTQDVEDLPREEAAGDTATTPASARQAEPAHPAVSGDQRASDAQRKYLSQLVEKTDIPYEIPADLTKADATRLIDALKKGDTSVIVSESCAVCGGANGTHTESCPEDVPF